MNTIQWQNLQAVASKIAALESGPGGIVDAEWSTIGTALDQLSKADDFEGIIRLREMFAFLITGETIGGLDVVIRLNDTAVRAAQETGRSKLAAKYIHDKAENYHRRGYHKQSIREFERAAVLYAEAREPRKALESYYFSALAYRALGKRDRTLAILHDVLTQIGPSDPWRANPLEVLSWIYKDQRRYAEAEATLRTALSLYQELEGTNNVHAVQTLADLGEILGLRGQFDDAKKAFAQSLTMLDSFKGQYRRQEARTKTKYAELLNAKREYRNALELLDSSCDKIRGYGHYYDSLLRIELARAVAYFGLRKWGLGLRKTRLAIDYCNEIGLPFTQVARLLLHGLLR